MFLQTNSNSVGQKEQDLNINSDEWVVKSSVSAIAQNG